MRLINEQHVGLDCRRSSARARLIDFLRPPNRARGVSPPSNGLIKLLETLLRLFVAVADAVLHRATVDDFFGRAMNRLRKFQGVVRKRQKLR